MKVIKSWGILKSYLIVVMAILLLGFYVIPKLIQNQVLKKVVISPDINPELYNAWIHPPIPVYFKIYLFNVSNPEQVQKGLPPELVEMGPYVFLENKTKVDVELDDARDTASYKEHITYHFCEELSHPWSLQDVVTIINVPFVSAAIKIENELLWPLDHIAHMILLNYNEPIFIQKTVEEVLFQGWKVPFLGKIEEDVGMSLLKNNTFGFFVGQNDSYQGPFKVRRGLHLGKNLLGEIIEYKNKTELSFWGEKDSPCNQILGTDGTIYPPMMNKDTIINLFNADLCRSLYLTYEDDASLHDIPGYRFIAPPSLLDDPRLSDKNRCFCKSVNTKPERCMGRGVLDMGPCKEGAPVAMSTPHFLDADPKYLRMIGAGLHPERGKHETYLEIEPLTGAVLRASKKIQINLILERVPRIPKLRNVTNMLFPLLWADEGASIDEGLANQLKSILFWIQATELVSKFISVFLSSIILSLCIKRFFAHDNDKIIKPKDVQQDVQNKNKTNWVHAGTREEFSTLQQGDSGVIA